MEIKFNNSVTHVYHGNAWALAGKLLAGKEVIIISDVNVSGFYSDFFPDYPLITIGTGEGVKEVETVETIVKQMVAIGADRSSFLLGIGGGIVCDITGFVASVFMRGIDFGFISTSLLSQVDASIGGKNGVNVNGIKNIIGCINQPSFVICDSGLLATLNDEEYISGLGELVKHAVIRDKALFEIIESNVKPILERKPDLLSELISRSIEIKAEVVEKDEKEHGERRILNFGHTLGHAIELSSGLSHGISIAIGMMAATGISFDEGLLSKPDAGRIKNLLKQLRLLPEVLPDWPVIGDIIYADKKIKGGEIYFILLEGIGAGIQKLFPVRDILEKLRNQF